jgi:hypothetical protein
MFEFILNKVLLVMFIMSTFNCLNHLWNITNALRKEVPDKYQTTKGERFLLGLSLSYIITSLITGIIF